MAVAGFKQLANDFLALLSNQINEDRIGRIFNNSEFQEIQRNLTVGVPAASLDQEALKLAREVSEKIVDLVLYADPEASPPIQNQTLYEGIRGLPMIIKAIDQHVQSNDSPEVDTHAQPEDEMTTFTEKDGTTFELEQIRSSGPTSSEQTKAGVTPKSTVSITATHVNKSEDIKAKASSPETWIMPPVEVPQPAGPNTDNKSSSVNHSTTPTALSGAAASGNTAMDTLQRLLGSLTINPLDEQQHLDDNDSVQAIKDALAEASALQDQDKIALTEPQQNAIRVFDLIDEMGKDIDRFATGEHRAEFLDKLAELAARLVSANNTGEGIRFLETTYNGRKNKGQPPTLEANLVNLNNKLIGLTGQNLPKTNVTFTQYQEFIISCGRSFNTYKNTQGNTDIDFLFDTNLINLLQAETANKLLRKANVNLPLAADITTAVENAKKHQLEVAAALQKVNNTYNPATASAVASEAKTALDLSIKAERIALLPVKSSNLSVASSVSQASASVALARKQMLQVVTVTGEVAVRSVKATLNLITNELPKAETAARSGKVGDAGSSVDNINSLLQQARVAQKAINDVINLDDSPAGTYATQLASQLKEADEAVAKIQQALEQALVFKDDASKRRKVTDLKSNVSHALDLINEIGKALNDDSVGPREQFLEKFADLAASLVEAGKIKENADLFRTEYLRRKNGSNPEIEKNFDKLNKKLYEWNEQLLPNNRQPLSLESYQKLIINGGRRLNFRPDATLGGQLKSDHLFDTKFIAILGNEIALPLLRAANGQNQPVQADILAAQAEAEKAAKTAEAHRQQAEAEKNKAETATKLDVASAATFKAIDALTEAEKASQAAVAAANTFVGEAKVYNSKEAADFAALAMEHSRIAKKSVIAAAQAMGALAVQSVEDALRLAQIEMTNAQAAAISGDTAAAEEALTAIELLQKRVNAAQSAVKSVIRLDQSSSRVYELALKKSSEGVDKGVIEINRLVTAVQTAKAGAVAEAARLSTRAEPPATRIAKHLSYHIGPLASLAFTEQDLWMSMRDLLKGVSIEDRKKFIAQINNALPRITELDTVMRSNYVELVLPDANEKQREFNRLVKQLIWVNDLRQKELREIEQELRENDPEFFKDSANITLFNTELTNRFGGIVGVRPIHHAAVVPVGGAGAYVMGALRSTILDDKDLNGPITKKIKAKIEQANSARKFLYNNVIVPQADDGTGIKLIEMKKDQREVFISQLQNERDQKLFRRAQQQEKFMGEAGKDVDPGLTELSWDVFGLQAKRLKEDTKNRVQIDILETYRLGIQQVKEDLKSQTDKAPEEPVTRGDITQKTKVATEQGFEYDLQTKQLFSRNKGNLENKASVKLLSDFDPDDIRSVLEAAKPNSPSPVSIRLWNELEHNDNPLDDDKRAAIQKCLRSIVWWGKKDIQFVSVRTIDNRGVANYDLKVQIGDKVVALPDSLKQIQVPPYANAHDWLFQQWSAVTFSELGNMKLADGSAKYLIAVTSVSEEQLQEAKPLGQARPPVPKNIECRKLTPDGSRELKISRSTVGHLLGEQGINKGPEEPPRVIPSRMKPI